MRDRFIEKYTIESKPRVWNMLWLERQNMMIYIGILSSPTCRSVNGVDIFNFTPRCKHNHDHCHYKSPILHEVLLNGLLPFMQKPLDRHHIRLKLCSLSHAKLHSLKISCGKPFHKSENVCKLTTMVLDIDRHILFIC